MGKLRDGRKGDAMIAAEVAVVSRRMVDDPMLTSAEHAHRAQVGRAVKVEVDIRLASLIGGLARMRRTPAQEQAAARYRGLWERAQIGGARATDYSAVRVDSSGPSEAAVWEMGEDARRGYGAAVRALGMVGSAVVEKVVCHEMSVRQAAEALGWGQGGAGRSRVLRLLREALAVLALHFQEAGVVRGSARLRMEGERPSRWDGDAAA
jgi:hypothetical protein